jgi:sporulation protein YlmC with PRC-barrel domain
MEKIKLSVVSILSVLSFLFLASGAFAQGAYEGVSTDYNQPIGSNTFEASWLIGHSVSSATDPGVYLGEISGLVIDRANERIALAVLSHVPHLGTTPVAVPFSSLKRTGPDTFALTGDIPIGSSNVVDNVNEDAYNYSNSKTQERSGLYDVPTTITPNWVTKIYRHYGQVPYWEEKGEKPLSAGMMEISALRGTDIRTADGEARARVDDIVIDGSDGRIAFVVLSDTTGTPNKLVAVPFGTLEIGKNAFALNITQNALATAPEFHEYGDMNNPRFAEGVYRYFGVQPYWTKEGR